MKNLLILVALLVTPTLASAAQLQLSWSVPTEACDGTPIPAEELTDIEIYLDTQPIPGPAEGDDPCAIANQDPPAGFTPTVVPANDGSVTLDVNGGKTYYARARVKHSSGLWSGLSVEGMKEVPLGAIRPPVMLMLNL